MAPGSPAPSYKSIDTPLRIPGIFFFLDLTPFVTKIPLNVKLLSLFNFVSLKLFLKKEHGSNDGKLNKKFTIIKKNLQFYLHPFFSTNK